MLEGAEVRLAVDIGGTFTDIVLDVGQHRRTRKLLTTPTRPEKAVLDGMRLILTDARAHICDIDVFIHGTTLATNAIIQRRGARTALVATEGFRDVLDIGTESRYDQYDLSIDKPKPLVPRALRFTIAERVDALHELGGGFDLLDQLVAADLGSHRRECVRSSQKPRRVLALLEPSEHTKSRCPASPLLSRCLLWHSGRYCE